jgi:hypothetical protein
MGPMMSWLSVTLSPSGDGTALELAHEAPVDPDRWEQFGPGAVGVGWDLALMGLGRHFESGGGAVDPEAALAFPTSPEGMAFVKSAAAGWADAAIDDGDDPGQARAAAGRTAAFYTGAPAEGS